MLNLSSKYLFFFKQSDIKSILNSLQSELECMYIGSKNAQQNLRYMRCAN